MRYILTIALLLVAATCCGQTYPFVDDYDSSQSVANRIRVPEGCRRMVVDSTSFADWLRHLPLKHPGTPVRLYNGDDKRNQTAHHAVVDIDCGRRNLQQCADAVIRLRAEYLYSRALYDSISFNFTSGDPAPYRKWITGSRPGVSGSSVAWKMTAEVDSSYEGFRKYLDVIFTYAGTLSLRRDLKKKHDVDSIAAGDVFVEGGSPGHAVIVLDVAVNEQTGERIFLLAQSYMPAQNIHILKNPTDLKLSPWYRSDFGDILRTPEWTFKADDLRSF